MGICETAKSIISSYIKEYGSARRVNRSVIDKQLGYCNYIQRELISEEYGETAEVFIRGGRISVTIKSLDFDISFRDNEAKNMLLDSSSITFSRVGEYIITDIVFSEDILD